MEEHRINIMDDTAPLVRSTQPEQPEEQQGPVVASIPERFVALLIDSGLIFILYQLFIAVIVRFVFFDLEQLYWLLAGINIPFILYMTLFTSGGRHTLGKKLVGIEVLDKDTGEPLGIVRAFVRTLSYYVSAVLLMGGFLLAFIDDKHRSLQDMTAGSIVVKYRPKSWLESMVLTLTGVILMSTFVGYFYNSFFGAGSFAQQRLINKAQEHLEKIGYLEEVHRMQYGYYTNDLLRLSILSGDPVQFQRDTQAVLEKKGFRIGVSEKGYKIKAHAKDVRKTPVYYPEF